MIGEEEKRQPGRQKTEAQRERQRRRNAKQRRNRIINLFNEVGGRCIYCRKRMWCKQLDQHGRRDDMATLEHIVPLARDGPPKKRSNQTCSCYHCNVLRKAMPHRLFTLVARLGLKSWVKPCRRFKQRRWDIYMRRLGRVLPYLKTILRFWNRG